MSTVIVSTQGSESPLPDFSGMRKREPEAASKITGNGAAGIAAVDANGVRHRTVDYRGGTVPWLADRIYALSPGYLDADRLHRHEGCGVFRLMLDLKTGLVTKVVTLTSTGFVTLDRCAIASLRQWRFKPGKWKEIDMPVRFTLQFHPKDRPRGPYGFSLGTGTFRVRRANPSSLLATPVYTRNSLERRLRKLFT